MDCGSASLCGLGPVVVPLCASNATPQWSIYEHSPVPSPGPGLGAGTPDRLLPPDMPSPGRGAWSVRWADAGSFRACTCSGPPKTARGQARRHGLPVNWTNQRVTERAPPRPPASSAEARPSHCQGRSTRAVGAMMSEGPALCQLPCPW